MMKSKKQNLEQMSQFLREQVIDTKTLTAVKGGANEPPPYNYCAR